MAAVNVTVTDDLCKAFIRYSFVHNAVERVSVENCMTLLFTTNRPDSVLLTDVDYLYHLPLYLLFRNSLYQPHDDDKKLLLSPKPYPGTFAEHVLATSIFATSIYFTPYSIKIPLPNNHLICPLKTRLLQRPSL